MLHAVRDRLQVNDAVSLGAQLPELLRGAYYEQWRPAKQRRPIRPDRKAAREAPPCKDATDAHLRAIEIWPDDWAASPVHCWAHVRLASPKHRENRTGRALAHLFKRASRNERTSYE